MFTIGVFPYLAIAATALFFSLSWPRKFAGFLLGLWQSFRGAAALRGSASEGGHDDQRAREEDVSAAPTRLGTRQWIVVSMLGVFLTMQLLVPLRHFLYPGNAGWTNEGCRFSWRMKLHDM